MARTAKPWYFQQKSAYYAHIRGRKLRLVAGPECPANEKLARKKLKELLRSTDPEPARPRVADIIDRYLTLHKSQYSTHAYAERFRILQLFAEDHGRRKVNDRDCLPVHVEEWIAAHTDWKSDWTIAQVVNIVLRPFNWAAKKRIIASNPFRGVEKAQGEPLRPMTDAEFQKILRNATVWTKRKPAVGRYPSGRKVCPSDRKRRQRPSPAGRFKQILVFLRYTGCRPAEARNLEWTDIDLEARELILRRHKTSKKTKKPRRIPLHPVVLKLLIFLKRLSQPGTHVFLTHRKTPWQRVSLGQRLKRSRRAAGVAEDAKLYGLRHRFATTALLNGVDIKTLAELLGHTSTRTSEHYLHLVGQRAHLAEAMLRANGSRPSSTVPRPGS
jgi:integrase